MHTKKQETLSSLAFYVCRNLLFSYFLFIKLFKGSLPGWNDTTCRLRFGQTHGLVEGSFSLGRKLAGVYWYYFDITVFKNLDSEVIPSGVFRCVI